MRSTRAAEAVAELGSLALKEMCTNVTFRHPAEFVGDEGDGGGILVVSGAQMVRGDIEACSGIGTR